MTLWLVGPTKLGKTQWSRSHGSHNYFQNYLNLEKYNPDAKYNVFDDWDWNSCNIYKSWLGCQEEFECTDKYHHKETIFGKIAIVSSNKEPMYYEKLDQDWIEGNVTVAYINEKLF